MKAAILMQSHTSISCSFQKSIKYCETQYQIVRVGSPALSLDLHAQGFINNDEQRRQWERDLLMYSEWPILHTEPLQSENSEQDLRVSILLVLPPIPWHCTEQGPF